MMDFENLLNEFEHACRGGDYEISVCLRKEIIKKVEQLQQKKDLAVEGFKQQVELADECVKENTELRKQLQQAQTKAERYEKAIKECVERMDEGGAGTRSFVYEKLKEVMEGTECMGK
ncbi:hypothetical protein [Aeribacillus composti]|uniref:hypothetical protein n=1 Tax=Aeribacillus composti TaxID=1868734 RepID=UPI003D1D7303